MTSHLRLAGHMSQDSVPSRGKKRCKCLEVGMSVSCCGNSKASAAGPMNKVGLGEIGDMETRSRRALKQCFKLQQP